MTLASRPPVAGVESPPRLELAVRSADVDPAAAVPAISLQVAVTAPPDVPIRSLALTAQVRIDARRRSYDPATRARLREVFGLPEQWDRSLRSLLWTQASLVVPPFSGTANGTLVLPCTYDLEVAGARLLHALRDGVVPLELLFSGTIFWEDEARRLRTARLPWDDEVRFALPVELWWRALDRFFPGSAWLRIDRDLFDRLLAWRSAEGLPGWDAALTALLERARPGALR